MDTDEVLTLAERALAQGDPEAAERVLARTWPNIEAGPAAAKHILASVRALQRRGDEAIQLMRAAANNEPSSLRHHIALGHLLSGAGKDADAANAYAKALTIDPNWPGLALVFSRAACQAGRHAEAEKAARQAVKDAPSADSWDALSNSLRAQGKGQDAFNAAVEALRLDPTHMNAMNAQGAALLLLGRAQEALEVFDQLAAAGIQAPVLSVNRGTALQMLGRVAEANAVLDEALRRWPSLPNLRQQVIQRRGT
jgi:tetratricopeptide (TPR) repeat protein